MRWGWMATYHYGDHIAVLKVKHKEPPSHLSPLAYRIRQLRNTQSAQLYASHFPPASSNQRPIRRVASFGSRFTYVRSYMCAKSSAQTIGNCLSINTAYTISHSFFLFTQRTIINVHWCTKNYVRCYMFTSYTVSYLTKNNN